MAAAESTDVVIIGGGISGLVTALELVRAGRRVTVLEGDGRDRFGGQARDATGAARLNDAGMAGETIRHLQRFCGEAAAANPLACHGALEFTVYDGAGALTISEASFFPDAP